MFARKIHYWGALLCALPVIVVIVTGLLLLLKKQLIWVQPPTMRAENPALVIHFDKILSAASSIPASQIHSWNDVKRLDVRPDKGIAKVVVNNDVEIQIDTHTAKVLQVAMRRSDVIESIHDGSYFGEWAKYTVFFNLRTHILNWLSIFVMYREEIRRIRLWD